MNFEIFNFQFGVSPVLKVSRWGSRVTTLLHMYQPLDDPFSLAAQFGAATKMAQVSVDGVANRRDRYRSFRL